MALNGGGEGTRDLAGVILINICSWIRRIADTIIKSRYIAEVRKLFLFKRQVYVNYYMYSLYYKIKDEKFTSPYFISCLDFIFIFLESLSNTVGFSVVGRSSIVEVTISRIESFTKWVGIALSVYVLLPNGNTMYGLESSRFSSNTLSVFGIVDRNRMS